MEYQEQEVRLQIKELDQRHLMRGVYPPTIINNIHDQPSEIENLDLKQTPSPTEPIKPKHFGPTKTINIV